MKPLLIEKGAFTVLLDRNRDEGFMRVDGRAWFLDADELAALGQYATGLSRELKREKAYALASSPRSAQA